LIAPAAAPANPYEREAREVKAHAIARWIWSELPRAARTDVRVRDALILMDQQKRDAVALAAEQHSPGPETWARVVELVRDKIADERHWLSMDAAR
jgi:hypothetical protein